MTAPPTPTTPSAGGTCPFSPDGQHVKSTVPGRNACQFCGAPMLRQEVTP